MEISTSDLLAILRAELGDSIAACELLASIAPALSDLDGEQRWLLGQIVAGRNQSAVAHDLGISHQAISRRMVVIRLALVGLRDVI